MNSIESLRQDYNSQVSWLNKITNDKVSEECIFVGSGDSYAAGLAAEYLTDHRSACYSPSDLLNSRFADRNKTYCFISVTGKTKANIKVAQRATGAGARTVAVTFNKGSKLAKACKEIVTVDIPRPPTPNAGFGTFVANVVTCLQMAGTSIPQKFNRWHSNGARLAQDLLDSAVLSQERPIYLLGNNIFYAIALYTSFQLAEFFGSSANAYKLEEFCHSPIFGLKNSSYVWILGHNESAVSRRLGAMGMRLAYFELARTDILSELFESIFFVQNLILLLSERYGHSELQYVLMKDVLKASSDIIY